MIMSIETEREARRGEQEAQPGFLRKLTDEIGLTTPEPPHSTAPLWPKDYRRSDERIREDICEALIREPHIDVSEVTVEVSNGNVTLDGTVPVRRMRYVIEDVAAACGGVKDVENRVRVERNYPPQPSPGMR
jgi:osmotically-inducible protein OsmY